MIGLVDVAERRDNHQKAEQFLDEAGALVQQHGAWLYMRQVLAKEDILEA